jgi:hypothetical protein
MPWPKLASVIAAVNECLEGKWRWQANPECKYLSIRVDMRDGTACLSNRDEDDITIEQLKKQFTDAPPEPVKEPEQIPGEEDVPEYEGETYYFAIIYQEYNQEGNKFPTWVGPKYQTSNYLWDQDASLMDCLDSILDPTSSPYDGLPQIIPTESFVYIKDGGGYEHLIKLMNKDDFLKAKKAQSNGNSNNL